MTARLSAPAVAPAPALLSAQPVALVSVLRVSVLRSMPAKRAVQALVSVLRVLCMKNAARATSASAADQGGGGGPLCDSSGVFDRRCARGGAGWGDASG